MDNGEPLKLVKQVKMIQHDGSEEGDDQEKRCYCNNAGGVESLLRGCSDDCSQRQTKVSNILEQQKCTVI